MCLNRFVINVNTLRIRQPIFLLSLFCNVFACLDIMFCTFKPKYALHLFEYVCFTLSQILLFLGCTLHLYRNLFILTFVLKPNIKTKFFFIKLWKVCNICAPVH